MSSFKSLLDTSGSPVVAVELRPPRAELETSAGIDAWIDIYHSIRSLTRQGFPVMVTDSAVGAQEENNLRHLVANLGETVPRDQVIPFLTCKHSLNFCLEYADQTIQRGFPSLVVLGGDKHAGRPRCVEHAWELRRHIRARHPELELGGWANPVQSPATQVGFLLEEHVNADFYLTQIVSHHQAGAVEAFLEEGRKRGLAMPGVFGVFYYRSANEKTLRMLSSFLPVPVEELLREFSEGATPVEICARTIRALLGLGVKHFYVSNLPLKGTARVLNEVMEKASLRAVGLR